MNTYGAGLRERHRQERSGGEVTMSEQETPCAEVPEFRRLRYFHGQMIGAQDFRDEQSYFRDKHRLHNRCLHGYGVVCGLRVVPEPAREECEPEAAAGRAALDAGLEQLEREHAELRADLGLLGDERQEALAGRAEEIEAKLEAIRREIEERCPPAREGLRVRIECGLALDCQGNELVVRRPVSVDLWRELGAEDRRRAEASAGDEGASLYLSLRFCEQSVEPVRPVHSDECGATPGCAYAKLQDSFRVRVTVDPPPADERCDPCCEACADPCLLLARIDGLRPGEALAPKDIHNEVRRRIALHSPVTITGVSWRHGASYSADLAAEVLGTNDEAGGIEVRFSAPVLTETLRPGVIGLMVIEGGRGRAGNVYHMQGDYLDLPDERTTDRLRFRQTSRETLQVGDQVVIQVRCDFILDPCCRAVDGENTGGRVPLLPEYAGEAAELRDPARPRPRGKSPYEGKPSYPAEPPREEPRACCIPAYGYGPWTSGNGMPGGTFESWFYIQ